MNVRFWSVISIIAYCTSYRAKFMFMFLYLRGMNKNKWLNGKEQCFNILPLNVFRLLP